jgi:two-component system, NarL family, response regulator NreC
VSERIGVLENALAALADDRLEADLRCEAERAAHTLAGSLGMFGFVSAADAARKLERELANLEPQCSPELPELLEQLRAGVNGPVVLCSDIGDSIPDGFETALTARRETPSHVYPARTPDTGGPAQPLGSRVGVLIADDDTLMRCGLRVLLEREQVDVLAEARDLASVTREVRSSHPDVLVLDLEMAGGVSMEAIDQLREQLSATRIVALSTRESAVFVRRVLAAGALGYVAKSHAQDELAQAVCATSRGETYISAHLASHMEASSPTLVLSSREVDVLRLLALGHTSVEIAKGLRLSVSTVKADRTRLRRKLGLGSRPSLVRYARESGLTRA